MAEKSGMSYLALAFVLFLGGDDSAAVKSPCGFVGMVAGGVERAAFKSPCGFETAGGWRSPLGSEGWVRGPTYREEVLGEPSVDAPLEAGTGTAKDL